MLDACGVARDSYAEAVRALELHANYLHRLVKNLGLEPTTMGVN